MAEKGNAEALEKLNAAKHLYRTCVSCVKVLDQSTRQRNQLHKLFDGDVISARVRLRETAEKLIFLNPIEFGKKAEDLIWKKCFYEPLQLFRANHSHIGPKERSWLSLLLQSAAGHYHLYLLKLQVRFPDLSHFHLLDFPFTPSIQQNGRRALEEEEREWIVESTYRSLIYLGDIGRYQTESGESSSEVPAHFYHRALDLNPYNGMAHNQLGTLYRKPKPIQAAYHYMRCIVSRDTYNGALGNLTQLLKQSLDSCEQDDSTDSILTGPPTGRILSTIAEILDENNNFEVNGCQLISDRAISALSELLDNRSEEESTDPNDIWSLFALNIMIIEYLEGNGSKNASIAAEVYVILLNRLIETINGWEELEGSALEVENSGEEEIEPIPEDEEPEPEPPKPEKKPMSKLATLLGRRRRGSEESSDAEREDDNDEEDDLKMNLSFHNGDLGEDDVIELEDSDSDGEQPEKTPSPQPSSSSSQPMEKSISENGEAIANGEDTPKWEEFLQEPLMAVLKTSLEYLASKPSLFKFFAKGEVVTGNLIILLNSLPESVHCLIEGAGQEGQTITEEIGDVPEEWTQKRPLPEDLLLQGCPVFEAALSNLNFSLKPLPQTAEDSLRLLIIRSLGFKLSSHPESGIKWNADEKLFESEAASDVIPSDSEETKQKERQENMMKSMARLRLTSELAELKRIGWIPVYLVPEADALINKLSVFKILVAARKFVTVISDSVIHELDRQKKDSPNAREAIRWLEHAFHQGTKFLRPQKKTEKKTISLDDKAKIMEGLSGDKKKEFRGILECSAYLGGTVAHGTTVVTILTLKGYASELSKLVSSFTEEDNIPGMSVDNSQAFLGRWQKHQRKGKKNG